MSHIDQHNRKTSLYRIAGKRCDIRIHADQMRMRRHLDRGDAVEVERGGRFSVATGEERQLVEDTLEKIEAECEEVELEKEWAKRQRQRSSKSGTGIASEVQAEHLSQCVVGFPGFDLRFGYPSTEEIEARKESISDWLHRLARLYPKRECVLIRKASGKKKRRQRKLTLAAVVPAAGKEVSAKSLNDLFEPTPDHVAQTDNDALVTDDDEHSQQRGKRASKARLCFQLDEPEGQCESESGNGLWRLSLHFQPSENQSLILPISWPAVSDGSLAMKAKLSPNYVRKLVNNTLASVSRVCQPLHDLVISTAGDKSASAMSGSHKWKIAPDHDLTVAVIGAAGRKGIRQKGGTLLQYTVLNKGKPIRIDRNIAWYAIGGPFARRHPRWFDKRVWVHEVVVPDREVVVSDEVACPQLDQANGDHAVSVLLSLHQAVDFLVDWSQRLAEIGCRVRLSSSLSGNRSFNLITQRLKPREDMDFSSGLFSADRVLEFDRRVVVDGEELSDEEFRRLVELKRPLVRLRGKWVFFDPRSDDARVISRLAEEMCQEPTVRISGLELFKRLVDSDPHENLESYDLSEVHARLSQVLSVLGDSAGLSAALPETPVGFCGELRQYQQIGFAWLSFLSNLGLGMCLADDMGLGKTIQTLAWLLSTKQAGATAPSLLVCPASVLRNWRDEADKFTPYPALRLFEHHGPSRPQTDISLFERAKQHDVILTTYATVTRDLHIFEKVRWHAVILDEAQNIKNSRSSQSKALRQLARQAPVRLALTGTPIENNLADLWTLMDFLNPGIIGSEFVFAQEFRRPVEKLGNKDVSQKLSRLIRPFILRRSKRDRTLIPDLPEKREKNEKCWLTSEQAELYSAVLRELEVELGTAAPKRKQTAVLAVLTKLKLVCDHPALLLKDRSEVGARSGKLNRLVEMLEEVLANGERALVFTQYAVMGEILEKHLKDRLKCGTLFLSGSDSVKRRAKMVQAFQNDSECPVFVLTRAGGTGLNLTAANHVFHFDRWWNPAVEDQATDRAYRIGQSKDVNVWKMVCQGTLEERINELIQKKRTLFQDVIDIHTDTDHSVASALCRMSAGELHEMLRLGTSAVCDQ